MKVMRIAIFVCATVLLSCGNESNVDTHAWYPIIEITAPTTDATYSENCNNLEISGSASLGDGPASEFTGISVTWRNDTTGASGGTLQRIVCLPGLPAWLCEHVWSITVELVPGDNRISITATDTATGEANTDTITIKKPDWSYTVSGTLRTGDLLGLGFDASHVQLRLSGGGTEQILRPKSGTEAGQYAATCLLNSSYTLTPITERTFNYLFQPSLRIFAIGGADVTNLDFQTTAYPITGSFQESGRPYVGNQWVTVASGGISWIQFVDTNGAFTFVVPNGTYNITPGQACTRCIYTPVDRVVVVNGGGVSGQDFLVSIAK